VIAGGEESLKSEVNSRRRASKSCCCTLFAVIKGAASIEDECAIEIPSSMQPPQDCTMGTGIVTLCEHSTSIIVRFKLIITNNFKDLS
jgi:hypothetical protein